MFDYKILHGTTQMDQVMSTVVMICEDAYRIYNLPDNRVLYMKSYGNEDVLYCAVDGVCVPFPDELVIVNVDKQTSESLRGKMYKSGMYTWEAYALAWKGQRFLKIASVSKHVPYELAKIKT